MPATGLTKLTAARYGESGELANSVVLAAVWHRVGRGCDGPLTKTP
jgi:hypothetical protein